MEVVEREARERPGAAERTRGAGSLGDAAARAVSGPMRPAFVAAAVLALALAVGFGVPQLSGDDDGGRTVVATVDGSDAATRAGACTLQGDGEDGAILASAACRSSRAAGSTRHGSSATAWSSPSRPSRSARTAAARSPCPDDL